MRFIPTTALHKISKLTKRIRFVSGGTASSKTISILMWLIDYCQVHDNKLISIVSETFPHLRKGAQRDFLNILQSHNYYDENSWNKTDSIYTFPTNSKIEFFSADQPGKVRGPRRDILFINEANNVSYEIFTQLEIRTRDIIWIDSNPTHEYWAYTELIPNYDIDFITLTYQHNEGLEKSIIQSIEAKRDNIQWFKVYGLGQLGEIEDRVFKDWKLIDEIPHEARLERYGLDFGYTNPSAIVGIYYLNGSYILDEVCYQPGLSNRQLADILKNVPQALVKADSAEPKSIDELKSYGINILPAEKGRDSVSHGFQYIQQQRISITKRSVNGIKEYRNLLNKKNKDGEYIIGEFVGNRHFLDALNYGMEKIQPSTDIKGQDLFISTFDPQLFG